MKERKRKGEKERRRKGEENILPSIRDFVVVRDSPIHGRGAFARQPIPKGTRIAEYAGIQVPLAELGRQIAGGETSGSYILRVDRLMAIDGERQGNEARFLNHCCSPNCEIVWFDGIPYVYAMTDIAAGAELLFNYRLGTDDPAPIPLDDARSWFPCHCGAPQCRGTMLAM